MEQARISPEIYEALPLAVREVYAPHEWAWLTDSQKALLIATETEPEWTD